MDVDIQRMFFKGIVLSPDSIEQILAGQDETRCQEKLMEDPKLFRRQFDECSADRHFMAGDIHHKTFGAENGGRCRCHGASAKHGSNVCKEFTIVGGRKHQVKSRVEVCDAIIRPTGLFER